MSKPSPVAVVLHETFEAALLPLLRSVGFAPARLSNVKPGLVVACAARPLDDRRRVEVTLWCEGGTGHGLRFRLDVVGPVNGVECHGEIELRVPWPEPESPRPSTLEQAAGQFLPHENPQRLRTAVTFLACAFAACADEIAGAVPELAPALRDAQATPAWRAAEKRARELWQGRHARGDVEERPVPATVVFVGGKLLMVDADGARLTFRFDTGAFDRTQPVSVSGWCRTAAGTSVATRLTCGCRTWTFDLRGELVGVGSAGG